MFSAPPYHGACASGSATGANASGRSVATSERPMQGMASSASYAGASAAGFRPEAIAQAALSSAVTNRAWSTGNVQMDDWLQQNIDDEPLLLRFARVNVMERVEIAAQLMKRTSSITNFNAYLAGCINKALRAPSSGNRSSPYPSDGGRDNASASPPVPSPVRTDHAFNSPMHSAVTPAPSSQGSASVSSFRAASAVPRTPESVASVGSTSARLAAASNTGVGGSKIASWALEALKDARNKGMFLARVCSQLDSATCSELHQLTPEWMYNIPMAVALGCRGGVDPSVAARLCLQSHADVGSPGKVMSLGDATDKPPMPLVILHLGSWHAVSQLAV